MCKGQASYCDFEDGHCDWNNVEGDNFDWWGVRKTTGNKTGRETLIFLCGGKIIYLGCRTLLVH